MNFYDLLIIYMACGAPFAVYYFLQNRHTLNSKRLGLNTFLNFIFWIPFALRILSENQSFKSVFDARDDSDSDIEMKIAPIRKNLETSIIGNIPQNAENIPQFSIFEIREIIERYTGLTIACQFERKTVQTENEFYKISAHKNPQLASICSDRRNRTRLFFHQTQARRDFLKLASAVKNKKVFCQTLEFAKLLNDSIAQTALEKLAQTTTLESVKTTENDLWKSETHKPQLISKTASARLNLSPATMNLRSKD